MGSWVNAALGCPECWMKSEAYPNRHRLRRKKTLEDGRNLEYRAIPNARDAGAYSPRRMVIADTPPSMSCRSRARFRRRALHPIRVVALLRHGPRLFSHHATACPVWMASLNGRDRLADEEIAQLHE